MLNYFLLTVPNILIYYIFSLSTLFFMISKIGELFVQSCESKNSNLLYYNQNLFSVSEPSSSWKSCNDAYYYTWKSDFSNDISGLSETTKDKLARSMGFCPHLRCQLSNISNPASDGTCPKNLCFTKIQNGGLTSGSCCYSKNGLFNSGGLIGYFNKTQKTAKPIYKKSRVVLGDVVGGADESYHSFVNANMVYPGLIATQCPLPSTLRDISRMISEQNVSLWIQLAPSSGGIDPDPDQANRNSSSCVVLPNALYASGLLSGPPERVPCWAPFVCQRFSPNSLEGEKEVVVRHLWLPSWPDFGVPDPSAEPALLAVSELAAGVLAQGGSVAVNCLSGRGRTGAMAALLLGQLLHARSNDQLADIVVAMRDNRDCMVEMPSQFRFVSHMLGLPDTATLSPACSVSSSSKLWLVMGILAVLLPMLIIAFVCFTGRNVRRWGYTKHLELRALADDE
jgi:hypothetical protein